MEGLTFTSVLWGMLPIKKAVRRPEDLDDGDEVIVTLRVLAG